eukprot:CAMPEP_0175404710 /NCGR_PEP_ID=MMETSP0095-20121207/38679_1 /TAXON_ID=311494 /ORGANISM="Alexandrium monilatum, Strain CCMP3105" /LENGTH=196 /DNA_ID=CAMNT_0016703529 /DNA_START=179 /DNA_END=769 /DNA_ORIENTATION=-
MHTDLMPPTRGNPCGDQGHGLFSSRGVCQDLDSCHGGLAVLANNARQEVLLVPVDPLADLAPQGRQPTVAEHRVVADEQADPELQVQVVVGSVGLGREQQAGARNVQPMQEAVVLLLVLDDAGGGRGQQRPQVPPEQGVPADGPLRLLLTLGALNLPTARLPHDEAIRQVHDDAGSRVITVMWKLHLRVDVCRQFI